MKFFKKKSSRKILLLVGRDNWQRDDSVNNSLLKNLKQKNIQIKWEDPVGRYTYKLRRFEQKNKWIPTSVKKYNFRLVLFIYSIFHWNYFNYLKGRKNPSIELRCEKLKKTILELGKENEIIILSRSSGGRISSLIADELNLQYIICLGYPFKNPLNEKEPSRYLHLQNLRTKMLIIQGSKDEYGDLEIENEYVLSPSTELLFVEGNHDFEISEKDWGKVFVKINKIIES